MYSNNTSNQDINQANWAYYGAMVMGGITMISFIIAKRQINKQNLVNTEIQHLWRIGFLSIFTWIWLMSFYYSLQKKDKLQKGIWGYYCLFSIQTYLSGIFFFKLVMIYYGASTTISCYLLGQKGLSNQKYFDQQFANRVFQIVYAIFVALFLISQVLYYYLPLNQSKSKPSPQPLLLISLVVSFNITNSILLMVAIFKIKKAVQICSDLAKPTCALQLFFILFVIWSGINIVSLITTVCYETENDKEYRIEFIVAFIKSVVYMLIMNFLGYTLVEMIKKPTNEIETSIVFRKSAIITTQKYTHASP